MTDEIRKVWVMQTRRGPVRLEEATREDLIELVQEQAKQIRIHHEKIVARARLFGGAYRPSSSSALPVGSPPNRPSAVMPPPMREVTKGLLGTTERLVPTESFERAAAPPQKTWCGVDAEGWRAIAELILTLFLIGLLGGAFGWWIAR